MPQKSFTWRSRRIKRSRKDRFEWGAALIATVAVSAILTSAEAAAIERNIKEETKPLVVQTLEIREEEPKTKPVVEIVEEVQTYDIPLDDEFQFFVIDLCEEHHIDPAVVFAMMYRESGFKEIPLVCFRFNPDGTKNEWQGLDASIYLTPNRM